MRRLRTKQVCEMLGYVACRKTGNRLRKEATRRILAPGSKIGHLRPMIRPGMMFTLAAVRQIWPEHFERRTETERELARQYREIDARIAAVATRIDQVARQALGRDEALAKAVRELRAVLGKRSAA